MKIHSPTVWEHFWNTLWASRSPLYAFEMTRQYYRITKYLDSLECDSERSEYIS